MSPATLAALRHWCAEHVDGEERPELAEPFGITVEGVTYAVATNGHAAILVACPPEIGPRRELGDTGLPSFAHDTLSSLVQKRPSATAPIAGPVLREWANPFAWWEAGYFDGLTASEREHIRAESERIPVWRGVLLGVPINRVLLHSALDILPESAEYSVGRLAVPTVRPSGHTNLPDSPAVSVEGFGWRVVVMAMLITRDYQEAWDSAPQLLAPSLAEVAHG